MSGIISAVGEFVTAGVTWVGDFAGLFVETTEGGGLANPILLVGLALAVAGFGVGLLKRLVQIK